MTSLTHAYASDDDEALPGGISTVQQTRDFLEPAVDLNDKTVMVTGGTGSFGKHFVRTVIARYKPRKLIIFSRDELKQYEMAQAYGPETYPFMRYFIGDVRSAPRLEMAMRGVDYVIHAAALKQVPIAEYNPFECVETNIMGAQNVVQAAIRCNVKRVIALSTDKAANPVNLYGATKLASDKIFVAANNMAGADGCRFSIVRYGNVAGSRGSVMPFFQKLIAEHADSLPITDPRMTRFWITLPAAVKFVVDSFDIMTGGELYVPRIPSMRITDLAEAIAPGAKTHEIGIRPGEKLHEEMIAADDSRRTLLLGDRYVVMPTIATWGYTAPDNGTEVPDGFSYTSDSNDLWLDVEQMRTLLDAEA
jgi:UDP-N-acetylglucosamine 4,6-dehydratase